MERANPFNNAHIEVVLKPSIEGTHNPTKIPASLFSAPNTPNHKEIENKKETKAAIKIKRVFQLKKRSNTKEQVSFLKETSTVGIDKAKELKF